MSAAIGLLPLLTKISYVKRKFPPSPNLRFLLTPLFLLTFLPLPTSKLSNYFRMRLKSIPLPLFLPKFMAFSSLSGKTIASPSSSHCQLLSVVHGCTWCNAREHHPLCILGKWCPPCSCTVPWLCRPTLRIITCPQPNLNPDTSLLKKLSWLPCAT